jgi:two-component system sensor histidine kinase RegB
MTSRLVSTRAPSAPQTIGLFLLLTRSGLLVLLFSQLPPLLTASYGVLSLLGLWRVLVAASRPGPLEWWAHLMLDLLLLTYFFAFQGGLTHPYLALLLLPLLWAVYLLPQQLLSVFVGFFLLSLFGLYQFASFFEIGQTPPLEALQNHLLEQWRSHLMILPALAGFAWLIRTLDARQQAENQRLKDRLAQQEQLSSLGLQAALSAHELATPLSSLEMLVEELRHQKHPPTLQADLALMAGQIQLCRQSLEKLKRPGDHPSPMRVDRWWQRLQHEWGVFFPQARLTWPMCAAGESAWMLTSPLLDQAVINLIDNAWKAHAHFLELSLEVDHAHRHLVIRVHNDAKTTLQGGLGIGLPLAKATLLSQGCEFQLVQHNQRFETCVKCPLLNTSGLQSSEHPPHP